jgi:hypothetical protein
VDNLPSLKVKVKVKSLLQNKKHPKANQSQAWSTRDTLAN